MIEFVIHCWILVGFLFALQHAKGESISKIENAWQRKVAWLLTLPAFVLVWFVVRTFEYLFMLASDMPRTCKVAVDSWHGITAEDKAQ